MEGTMRNEVIGIAKHQSGINHLGRLVTESKIFDFRYLAGMQQASSKHKMMKGNGQCKHSRFGWLSNCIGLGNLSAKSPKDHLNLGMTIRSADD